MKSSLFLFAILLSLPSTALAQDLTGYILVRNYDFGTSTESTVKNITDLAVDFKPYGVAGTTPINREWQRYQQFNTQNFVFTETDLELTALPNLGGVFRGGISSGQITTKEVFYPTNDKTVVLQIRAKVPNGRGAWPAFWMYAPGGDDRTTSEIDIFEFFDTPTQNSFDWTGYDHGDGVGTNYYNIMTNRWVWHPGFDFSADYHVYTLIWSEGSIQKWVDNTLVKGTYFDWYGPDPQVLINLAIGGNTNNPPSDATFPSKFQVDYFRVYEKETEDLPNVPGTIQAENWLSMSGVQTQKTKDEGGGKNVGWLDAGDYMNYSVTSSTGGPTTVQFRVSGWSNSGQLRLKLGDAVLATVNVPNTGGFQNWVTTEPVPVILLPGTQTLKVEVVSGDFNINWISFGEN